METQSRAEEYRRISLIAHSRIPVAEDSPIFNLFAQRREICKRLEKTQTDLDRKQSVEYLDYVETKIKQYFLL
jgi:hypothetical protein